VATFILCASAAALPWYERGTDALRNGAYYQASKAFEEAIGIDNRFALAHARLAQAWTELDYTDKAKDELLYCRHSSWEPLVANHRWMRFIWMPSLLLCKEILRRG